MKKVFITNLILFVFLFIFAEIISYYKVYKTVGKYINICNALAKKNNNDSSYRSIRYAFLKPYNQDEDTLCRKNCYGNSSKKSILFFGCSYTYGWGVQENETMPFLVNKYTKRTTINKGIPGGSIINSIVTLTDKKFYDIYKTNPEPDYIIYTFINDHLARIVSYYKIFFIVNDKRFNKYEIMPYFILNKNGQIERKEYSKLLYPLFFLYTTKAVNLAYQYSYFGNSDRENKRYNKMIELLCIAKNITEKKFKNSKFVILFYKDSDLEVNKDFENNLKNNGFIVLDAETLAGHELQSQKWKAEDKTHPNAAAFEDVTKGLIKALNL